MAAVLIVVALLLPIGWHLLIVWDRGDLLWNRLKASLGEFGALVVWVAGYLLIVFVVIGAAQWTGVGGQALVAFALSLAAVTLFRYLNGEHIELG